MLRLILIYYFTHTCELTSQGLQQSTSNLDAHDERSLVAAETTKQHLSIEELCKKSCYLFIMTEKAGKIGKNSMITQYQIKTLTYMEAFLMEAMDGRWTGESGIREF